MQALQTEILKKSMLQPDEKSTMEKGEISIVRIGDVSIARAILQPGWTWDECVKPQVNTESCQVEHLEYIISGRLEVTMDDGTIREFGPGDVCHIPVGHHASVIGDESVELLDFAGGLEEIAKSLK